MKTIHYFCQKPLSAEAQDLIRFDAESIGQVVASQHETAPEVWLVDPSAYEKNGHMLRDSPTARLLAYSPQSRILYATDGCNSCARRLNANLDTLSEDELRRLAEDNEIRPDVIERLAHIVRGGVHS